MQCVTVSYGQVRGKAKQYPYFQPAVYETATRKDGTAVWKYLHHAGEAHRSASLAEADAKDLADRLGVPYLPDVRQYVRVEATEPKDIDR